ncbi:glycosyltransferase family 4 protein [Tissierella pigra]|uniref:Glycosyltransferase family 4 protein n=1 Tax=Tissierella pigra TaxID=2607614 RepID=A0A6N7Y282_9FIRM|nr:glycosyltransferase family 4 protein [Tissierella pigra]MSU02130.1 glycosyltransferase family 4 protein [Tissierella pigra]
MKKVLFTATIDEHILSFHIPFIQLFKSKGYEVHVASKGNKIIPLIDKKYNVDFERSPFKISNITAYTQLKKIINENNYDLIHCHTPMGATLTRIAARKSRLRGAKVIYTAHGFHFLKGASLKNWVIYYPVEKWLSRYTDCLITINEEDYNIAISKKFKAEKIKLVNGVGVDLNEFQAQTIEKKLQMRKEYGYKEEDIILFYAAELNHNKHQDLLINVIKDLKQKIPNIKLLLAGNGILENHYREQAKELELNSNIEFLGFRSDIPNLLMLSDIAVASSRREGLPINVMEAMATGLPLVVTNVRGHRDLVIDGKNGYVIEQDNVKEFANSIDKIFRDKALRDEFSRKGVELVQDYSLENVLKEMVEIYNETLNYNQ